MKNVISLETAMTLIASKDFETLYNSSVEFTTQNVVMDGRYFHFEITDNDEIIPKDNRLLASIVSWGQDGQPGKTWAEFLLFKKKLPKEFENWYFQCSDGEIFIIKYLRWCFSHKQRIPKELYSYVEDFVPAIKYFMTYKLRYDDE